jgi:hypothetical protein
LECLGLFHVLSGRCLDRSADSFGIANYQRIGPGTNNKAFGMRDS